MTSFFDSIKKSIGLGSKPQKKSTSDSNFETFDLQFREEKFGMGISLYDISQISEGCGARVDTVAVNSEAFNLGVKVGDVIISLEGNKLTKFDDFYDFLTVLPRPLTIRFIRFYEANTTPTAQKSSTFGNIFKPAQTQPNLSEAEKLQQKDAIAKAAQKRSEEFDKKWNKPNGSSSSKKVVDDKAEKPVVTTATTKSTTIAVASASQAAVVSESEKEQRRLALSKAAEDRSKQWDKKLNNKRLERTTSEEENDNNAAASSLSPDDNNDNNNNQENDELNPETKRVIEQTKQLELRIEQSLGYSPFRPHMSFAGSHVPSSSNTPSPVINIAATTAAAITAIDNNVSEEEAEDMAAAVDDAFAMLLSLDDSQQEAAKTAVLTVQKMLMNLYQHIQDVKFRSIRTSNKAFQNKVGCVSGGVELLLAAGFVYRSEGLAVEGLSNASAAATASNVMIASPIATASSSALTKAYEEEGSFSLSEGYLVHEITSSLAQRKLAYTLSRLQELMTLQEQYAAIK